MHLPGLHADAQNERSLDLRDQRALKPRNPVTYTEGGNAAGTGVLWLRANLRRQSFQRTPKDTGLSTFGLTDPPVAWRKVRRLAPLASELSPVLPSLSGPTPRGSTRRRRESLSDVDSEDDAF
jgi:hypothetical protein